MLAEMKLQAIKSTASENKRLLRLNRAAKKKHEIRVIRNKIIKTARAQIGDSYRAGHSGPNAFDCSGLVRFVFKQVTGKTLPHYSKAQYQQARKIKKSAALPGDLVFFFENGAHHVGIYIGKGKMIDAPRVGEKVRISPISGSWWGRSYTGMGRILPA
jgi:cell wall-associated NlpC family hydrolase